MTTHLLTRAAMSLQDAGSALRSLWGRPVDTPARPAVLTPDWVADSARAAGFSVQIEKLDDWEGRTDVELMGELTSRLGHVRGRLIVVTEASYGAAGTAFCFDAAMLEDFMRDHAQCYEPVFNGDVIVAALESGKIACIHHESYLFLLSPPRPSE